MRRKRFLIIGWIISLGMAFLVGLGLGTYYHNEIVVSWWNITGGPRIPISSVAPATAFVDPSAISYLELANSSERIPLVFSDTLDEVIIQQKLQQGAVVLPLGTSFGETGNVVVTAHSSGTENFGPYRFAFSHLAELNEGDRFTISTPKATYTYQVYGKEIVWPTQVDKLPSDDRSTVTLVTCWPLWTNFKRLLVNSELVSVEY